MRKISGLCLLAGGLVVGACGDDGGGSGNIFPEKPECAGEPVVAYAGNNHQVISKLEIGSNMDGFDLDSDGDPDNKLAAIASLAGTAISDSLATYEIVIPFEFFDLQAAAPDTCVKFGIYLGDYPTDADMDGDNAYVSEGDCNDKVAAIKRGATEVVGDGFDNDCDGKADEDAQNNASTSTNDDDVDGVTLAMGDCDDHNAMVKPGLPEVCGDGFDNDCDGVADRTQDAMGVATACSPFEPGKADIHLDRLSFETGTSNPVIIFKDGIISQGPSGLVLDSGPSLFSVAIPVTDGITLDLRISGATIQADVVQAGPAIVLKNGRLGGVIEGKTADTIRGLEVEQIGLLPENSLLDATFANLLGPLLALPKAKESITKKYPGCRTPDIDVDQDGLEAFCDSNPDDEIKEVDVCIDGDGTEIMDIGAQGAVSMHCSEAVKDGKNRFVDGISVALKFDTTAVKSIKPPR